MTRSGVRLSLDRVGRPCYGRAPMEVKMKSTAIPREFERRAAGKLRAALVLRQVPVELIDRIPGVCQEQTGPAPDVPWGIAPGYLLAALAKGWVSIAAVEIALEDPEPLATVVADTAAAIRQENDNVVRRLREIRSMGNPLSPGDEQLLAVARELGIGGGDA